MMDGRSAAEVVAAKQRMRAEAKASRAAIPPELRQLAAERIANVGLAFLGPLPSGAVVSGFLPIGEEINPLPLMRRLAAAGHGLALPVMIAKGQPLIFRIWTPGAPLVSRMWGIREPDATAPEAVPDVLLVPLLAVELNGLRLGYGGGFYDRTIAALRRTKPIVAVGIAYDSQVVDAVPHLDYDERLDWVLTPEGPLRCRP
jgi:5-formyltetrahydrofolate cyclo-ligase